MFNDICEFITHIESGTEFTYAISDTRILKLLNANFRSIIYRDGDAKIIFSGSTFELSQLFDDPDVAWAEAGWGNPAVED